jgi:hypothetical protein
VADFLRGMVEVLAAVKHALGNEGSHALGCSVTAPAPLAGSQGRRRFATSPIIRALIKHAYKLLPAISHWHPLKTEKNRRLR